MMSFSLCLSVILTAFAIRVYSENCTTPHGSQGACVPLHSCPPVVQAFANPLKGTEEALRKFICRTTRASIYVCCETSWNSVSFTKQLSDKTFCGFQHADDYVSTRTGATIDEFPWLAGIVAVELPSRRKTIVCQGALINRRYILTSVQCLVGREDSHSMTTLVRLGEFSVKNTTDCVQVSGSVDEDCSIAVDIAIEEKILHPLYNPRFGLNDIALVRLNKSVDYTDFIRPICLPIPGTRLATPGETLYVTGWGHKTSGGELADVKKKITTTLITNEACQETIRENRLSLTLYHMCTIDMKNNTEFTCAHDAGAPVMFSSYKNQWHLEGISSKGFPCGLGLPELKTRVSGYIEWIRQNMRLLNYDL